jgi:hypothetical protein
MTAGMARQGGLVQLERSDMRLAFNMAKLAKCGIYRTAIEKTQYIFNIHRAKVREDKMSEN